MGASSQVNGVPGGLGYGAQGMTSHGVHGSHGPINAAGILGQGHQGIPGFGSQTMAGQVGAQGMMPPGMEAPGYGTQNGANYNGQPGAIYHVPAGTQSSVGQPGQQGYTMTGVQGGTAMGMMGDPNGMSAGMMPQAGMAQAPSYPTTPQGPGTQSVFNPGLTTTPLAGAGTGMVLSGPNTPSAGIAQPMMMSTPLTGNSPIKGILKKGVSAVGGPNEEGDGLLCTVPEHHDLEDYVSKLQGKIRKLKSKLRDSQDISGDDKHVLFEEDVEKQMIRRLQAELEERRQDLESLDLAIERQKEHLNKTTKKERKLQSKRDGALKELENLRHRSGRSKAARKTFLDGDYDVSISDSDTEYEYEPSSRYTGRKDYIQQEIICLEETLARRRAELREADRLLNECEIDLSDARHEAKVTVHQFQEARSGISNTLHDAQELEDRAYNAGVQLIKAQEEMEIITAEVLELRDEKAQHENMLSNVDKVIGSKDAEFCNLDAKIKQATQRLHDLQFDLHSAEGQQREHLAIMKESDQLLSEKRRELEHISQQIAAERHNHDSLSKLIEQEKSTLGDLEGTLRKRHSQLETLDRDVAAEVNVKRREIQDIDSELIDLTQKRQKLDTEMKQVQQNIEREEEVLQNVAAMTSKRKQDLFTAEELLKKYTPQLKTLKTELSQKHEKHREISKKLREEEAELDRLKSEARKRSSDIEALSRKAANERDEIETLKDQKRHLEEDVETLEKNKGLLDDKAKDMQKKLSDMKRAQAQMEDNIRGGQKKMTALEQDVQYIEDLLDTATNQHASMDKELRRMHTSAQEGRLDLNELHSDIHEAEHTVNRLDQREADRLGRTANRFSGLEDRVKSLAQEISNREQEKKQLSTALDRSVQDLHELRRQIKQEREEMGQRIRHLEADTRGFRQEIDDRNKELQHMRTKTANEIADLEGIAQAHCSRANRLSDELSYLRAEYLEVKRQLDSQQEMAEREKRLEETIKDLKSDIKYEVTDSLLEIEKQKMQEPAPEASTELETSPPTNNDLATHLANLKHNLALIRRDDSGIHTSSDSLRESLLERQNFYKQQLDQRMLRQSELIHAQGQISQENLLQLQQKLSTIEQVYSQAERPSVDSQSSDQSKSQELFSGESDSGNDRNNSQESGNSTKEVPKRAYSPHRYSNRRSPRQSLTTQIPEKDLSS